MVTSFCVRELYFSETAYLVCPSSRRVCVFSSKSLSIYLSENLSRLERQQRACRARTAGMAQRPAAIIFDLDGCLWDPEMYELWGGGAPFSDNGDGTLADKAGVTVRLLGAV
jgi:hypothetical protein